MKNGVKYVISENGRKEGRASAYVRMEVGSNDEEEELGERGLAHFVEHLAFDNSRDYKGRGAIFHVLEGLGAQFNAWTDWRTTNYMILDFPFHNISQVMKVLKNQVFYSQPSNQSVEMEKGAVLGEERYRMSSEYEGLVKVLKNHGPLYRFFSHFTIGNVSQILHFDASQVTNFRKKWYLPSRATLFLVGDYNSSSLLHSHQTQPTSTGWSVGEVEEYLKSEWEGVVVEGEEKEHPKQEGSISPSQLVYESSVEGIGGVHFYLLSSSPFLHNPSSSLHSLHLSFLDSLFSLLFQFLFRSLSSSSSPPFSASYSTDGDFSLNLTLSTLSIVIPSSEEGGESVVSWEEAFHTCLLTLQTLARKEGGEKRHLILLFFSQFNSLLSLQPSSPPTDSTTLIQQIFGDADPSFIYLDPSQLYSLLSPCSSLLSLSSSFTIFLTYSLFFSFSSLFFHSLFSKKKSSGVGFFGDD